MTPVRRVGVLAVALAVVLAACGGGGKPHATKKISSTPTTKPVPVAPLTGLPDPTGAARARPALTVKVENTPMARPQWGIDKADVIYEEVVEGSITRLAAIFNSQAPDRIGPVRSVRKTDQSIVRPIGGIFAYSGGAQYAIDSIDTAPVKQLDETRAGDAMFRDHSRQAPHNLYGIGPALFTKGAGATPVPPPPLFEYRSAKSPAFAGSAVTSFVVGFEAGYATTFTWDAPSGTWKRSIFGHPDVTATGVQLAPKNVVVMFADYVGGNDEGLGAEATLTGSGTAWVFSDGKVSKGRWTRPDATKPATFVDQADNDILLEPGQTWVEIPKTSYTVTTTSPPPPASATTAP